MAFYHVLIATDQNDPNSWREVFKDLTETALRREFVKPYKDGTALLSGNDIIRVQTIEKLCIQETEKPNRDERDAIYRRSTQQREEFNQSSSSLWLMPAGHGYHVEDICGAGHDVTSRFIHGPPGYAAHRRKYVKWAVGIAATVMAVIGGIWREWAREHATLMSNSSTRQAYPAIVTAKRSVKQAAPGHPVRQAGKHLVPTAVTERKLLFWQSDHGRRVQLEFGVPVELFPGFRLTVETIESVRGGHGLQAQIWSPSWSSERSGMPFLKAGDPPFDVSHAGRLYQLKVESVAENLVTIFVRPVQ